MKLYLKRNIIVGEATIIMLQRGGDDLAATRIDTERGYELLKRSRFRLTREQLNAKLEATGFHPISPRTYEHYFKLRDHGFKKYLSINRFDIAVLRDPLWDGQARVQYASEIVTRPISMFVELPDAQLCLTGETLEVSPSDVVCEFKEPQAVAFFSHPAASQLVKAADLWIIIGEATEVNVSVVSWTMSTNAESEQSVVEVHLDFASYVPSERLVVRKLLSESTIRFSFVPSYEHASLHETVRKLYWLNQVSEASRTLCHAVLEQAGLADDYALPSPSIHRVTSNSPLTGWLGGAGAVVAFLAACWYSIQKARTQYWSVERTKYLVKRVQIDNERAQLKNDFMRNAIPEMLNKVQQETGAELSAPILKTLLEPDSVVAQILEHQLIPSLQQLADENAGHFSIDGPKEQEPTTKETPNK